MKNNSYSGEAIIRKAFYRSVIAITVFGIAAFAIYHFTRQQPETAAITEQDIKGPVLTQPAPEQIPAIRFTDITDQAGINFVHINGAYGERLLPETMTGGGGFLDYDNDGDQDIILINATYWPDQPQKEKPTTRLYNNDGKGNFTDVSEET